MAQTETELQVAVLQCAKYLEDQRFETARVSLSEPTANRSIAETLEEIVTSQSVNTAELAAVDCVYYHQDRFEAIIDARGFKPSDIVCTMMAQYVELKGNKQSSSQNDLKGNRNMTRRYQLPEPVAAEKGACLLSSEGILVLSAPWIQPKKSKAQSKSNGPVTSMPTLGGPETPKSKIPLKSYI